MCVENRWQAIRMKIGFRILHGRGWERSVFAVLLELRQLRNCLAFDTLKSPIASTIRVPMMIGGWGSKNSWIKLLKLGRRSLVTSELFYYHNRRLQWMFNRRLTTAPSKQSDINIYVRSFLLSRM